MPDKTTTAQLVSHPLQFIVETTEGTQATGTATVVGIVDSLGIKKDGAYIEVGQLGPEDLASLIKGLETFEWQVSIKPTSETFFKRGIVAANYGTPAGTVSETMSVFFAIYLNGTINYINFLGSRPRDITYAREKGKDDICTMNFKSTDITAPSTTPPATVTLSSTFPTGTVWSHITGGATPLSVSGVGVNATKFSITVNRNTTEDHTLGNTKPYGTQPHGRRIGGDFMILWSNDDVEVLYDAETLHTIALVLNSTGPVTLTCSNSAITTHGKDIDQASDEAVPEAATFKSLTAGVA